MFANSGVIADKAYDAMLPMPMKDVKATAVETYAVLSVPMTRDMKITVDEACDMPMGQESMKASS